MGTQDACPESPRMFSLLFFFCFFFAHNITLLDRRYGDGVAGTGAHERRRAGR
jgi:hypothetical protein